MVATVKYANIMGSWAQQKYLLLMVEKYHFDRNARSTLRKLFENNNTLALLLPHG